MIHHPYGHDELDRPDPELDEVARSLQAHAEASGAKVPSPDLAARIHAAIDAEPDPNQGWWARFVSGSAAGARVLRGAFVAGVAAAAVVAAVAFGGLLDGIRNVGSSPSPLVTPSDEGSPTPTTPSTPTTSLPPSPSPSPSPSSPSPLPSGTPAPTATDDDDDDDPDDASESPEPDDSESPEPDESDHDGPDD